MNPLFGKQAKAGELTRQKLQAEKQQLKLEIQELQSKLEQANQTDQKTSICFANNMLATKSQKRLEKMSNQADNFFKMLLEQKIFIGNKKFCIRRKTLYKIDGKDLDNYLIWKEIKYQIRAERA